MLDPLRDVGVISATNAQLAILIKPEGVELGVHTHDQRVVASTGHIEYLLALQVVILLRLPYMSGGHLSALPVSIASEREHFSHFAEQEGVLEASTHHSHSLVHSVQLGRE